MRWPSGEKATGLESEGWPPEREQFLAAGRLPDLGRPIHTAGDNPPAVRRKGCPIDIGAVTSESQQLFAAGRLPDSGSAVPTRGDSPLAVRGKGQGLDQAAMPFEGAHFQAGSRVPQPGCPIRTGRCDPSATRRKNRRVDVGVVPLEREQFFAAAHIPHLRRVVVTPGDNPATIWRKGRRMNHVAVAKESFEFQVGLPPPVIPFKAAPRVAGRLVEQLPHSADIVLLPGLLGAVQVDDVGLGLGAPALFGLPGLRGLRLPLVGLRLPAGLRRPQRLRGAQENARQERRRHRRRRRNRSSMAAHELPRPVGGAGRPGHHRLVRQVPLEVSGQPVGRLIAPPPILLEAFHHDPVQVPA